MTSQNIDWARPYELSPELVKRHWEHLTGFSEPLKRKILFFWTS